MDMLLDSMALELNALSERFLTDKITAETYAFDVHDVLQQLPMPQAPQHLVVLRRLKDWAHMELITEEQKQALQRRVIAAW